MALLPPGSPRRWIVARTSPPRVFVLFALVWMAGCQVSGEQGRVVGTLAVNGARRTLDAPILAATFQPGETGWLAVELAPEGVEAGGLTPPLGPVCIWISGRVLPGAGGVIPASEPFADVPPPFTREDWYCLPPEGDPDVFIGMRCPVAEGEILPTTPLPETPTPAETPAPTPTPTPAADATATPAPTPEPAPFLRAAQGDLSLGAGLTGPCDTLTLVLEDVVFLRESCGGSVRNLRFETLTVTATVLGVGRDWSTGGGAACR